MQIEAEIEPPKKKEGERVEFTEEIFTAICERMAEGEGLRKICRDPEMPDRTTVLRWIENDTGRQTKYQRAREALMDWYSEEILEIAFDDKGDIISEGGKIMGNHAAVQRARLKVDALKWTMSKLHPKRYGDKLTHEAETNEAIKLSWEQPKRLERVIIEPVSPIWDENDELVNADDPVALRAHIRYLKDKLAGKVPEQPPKLLTFDPGPLPSRMDGEIVTRLVDIIKANIPQADQRDPLSVLDEVMTIINDALGERYGENIPAENI